MHNSEAVRSQLGGNLEKVRERISTARARSGNSGEFPRIVVVTKYVEPEIAGEMLSLGLSDFGENRLRIAERKLTALRELPITWHWIGHLQTNKVRKALESFQVFHSVDRLSVLEEIENRLAPEEGRDPLPCFLQINVSGESTKYGVAPEDAKELGERFLACGQVRWVGLMTMAPHEEDPEKTRPVFARLRELRDRLESELGTSLPRLSMGMSNDFEIAVEEGATDLRLGSVLFEGLI
jgi:pyridoxal phosphate enzyme (YggS family)